MQDDDTNGIPTRAIHESYINLQQIHHEYRTARDRGEDTHALRGEFQEAVLTFYELVRPHLKHETALSGYWNGDLPEYTGWDFDSEREAVSYIQDKGTGVYQVQKHTNVFRVDQQVLTDGGVQGFDTWHELLGLSWDSERLIAIQPADDNQYFAKVLRTAVLPLRELDSWQATITRERTQGDGFMAGEAATQTRRKFEPDAKLVTAKRLLVEAADKLGALSEFEASTSRTEITRDDIEKVEEWHEQQTQ